MALVAVLLTCQTLTLHLPFLRPRVDTVLTVTEVILAAAIPCETITAQRVRIHLSRAFATDERRRQLETLHRRRDIQEQFLFRCPTPHRRRPNQPTHCVLFNPVTAFRQFLVRIRCNTTDRSKYSRTRLHSHFPRIHPIVKFVFIPAARQGIRHGATPHRFVYCWSSKRCVMEMFRTLFSILFLWTVVSGAGVLLRWSRT